MKLIAISPEKTILVFPKRRSRFLFLKLLQKSLYLEQLKQTKMLRLFLCPDSTESGPAALRYSWHEATLVLWGLSQTDRLANNALAVQVKTNNASSVVSTCWVEVKNPKRSSTTTCFHFLECAGLSVECFLIAVYPVSRALEPRSLSVS